MKLGKIEINFSIKKFLIFLLLGYIAILAFLFFFQRNLLYIPKGAPIKIAQNFVEKTLTTSDGVEILSWFKKPKKNNRVILYLHGNAGNLGGRSHRFESFANDGYGVMAISYRGYFGSTGSPFEIGLINDAKAAFKYLLDLGYLPKDIILYGESLGSGVAVQMAAKFDVAAVILESPYSSVKSIAQKTYWFLPVSLLLKDKFESIKFVSQISAPVLIFHGTLDQIVPLNEGKELFLAIKSRKKFIEVKNAGHVNFSDQFLISEIDKFLKEGK